MFEEFILKIVGGAKNLGIIKQQFETIFPNKQTMKMKWFSRENNQQNILFFPINYYIKYFFLIKKEF